MIQIFIFPIFRIRASHQRAGRSQWKKTIAWAYEKSGIYKRKFDAAGVTPDDLRTLDDISKFPFTTERELQEHSPHEFLTLPFSAISRISLWEHPTPIIRMYTARDIACNVEMMTRSLVATRTLPAKSPLLRLP